MVDEKIFFDDFEIDTLKRCLLKAGRLVPLDPKAFDLLVALAARRGVMVSNQELLDLVWANQFVEEKNLAVHVTAIRRALGETTKEHRFIVTIPGYGYKFVAKLNGSAQNGTIPKTPLSGSSGEKDSTQFDWLTKRRLLTGGLTAVVFLAVIAGIYFWQSRRKTDVLAVPSSQNFSIKRLTTNGKATSAVLSPDGKLFAYSRFDGEDQSLWLGHIDGGEPVQIRPPALVIYLDFKFSPDASSLFYSLTDDDGGNGAVFKMPVFGGLPEKIEDKAYSITFSPSGKQFAFVRGGSADAKSVLVVSDADGKNENEMATSPDMMNFVRRGSAWSPDGSTIAIGASRSDTNTGYEVFTINTADSSVKPLTNAAWSNVGAMAWLADGSGLVMVGQKEGSTQAQLWFVSFPSGEVKHLVSDLNLYGSTISLGKDQNSLVIVQGQVQSNIWIAPADNLANAKQVTFGSIGRMDGWFGIKWMADGKIAYTADGGENNSIWTMNSNGSEQKQLIPFEGNNVYPSVTADDRFVAFQSNRDGGYAVWRANRDGTDILRLTDTGVAAQPSISPDGQWIVYITNPENSGQLWRITISGDDPVKLADTVYWPQISPDSRTVACGYFVDGKPRLALLSIDDGAIIKMFDLPPRANLRLGVHWTPDGKAVTYRDWVNGIWRQDISGGEPKRLKGLPSEKLYAYDWSPDSKFFAFTRGTETRDVVLISDFR